MAEQKIAPYGSWKSPVSSSMVATKVVGLGSLDLQGEAVYWAEMRPDEGGRYALERFTTGEGTQDLVPLPYNVRSTVHEYGGKSYAVSADGTVYFSNYSDQRIYVTRRGEQPTPLTPGDKLRYADQQIDSGRRRLIAVREDHSQSDQAAVNTLVSMRLRDGGDERILASGNDFYASPALSPDGNTLAYLTWNHPNMPWDGCELWLAKLDGGGAVQSQQRIAGGPEESIFQPTWSSTGLLVYASDRSNWWNLYAWDGKAETALYPMEAEFALPQWIFGRKLFAFVGNDRILCSYMQGGSSHLALLDLQDKHFENLKIPYTYIGGLVANEQEAYLIGGSPTRPSAVIRYRIASGETQEIRRSRELDIDPGYLSLPQPVEFPTENGLTAHGFFYPPQNKDYIAPQGELPPLIVESHGGPTSATVDLLDLGQQYWTNRGIAVLDVNYGGSTGYGREYRQRLNGNWGVVDVDDCINGARYLADKGWVDPERLIIHGGSAGGYTTLAALTFRDVFKAGASHFGIGDLEPFGQDTHKFESRYMDSLVGPYPERQDIYYERSPIHFTERLNAPMILLQGLEDRIVPPNQAETMFAAVKARGLPVAYVPFEGEQHGFRKAENIQRALEAEYYFYAKVFGFEPADSIEPVQIENLPPGS